MKLAKQPCAPYRLQQRHDACPTGLSCIKCNRSDLSQQLLRQRSELPLKPGLVIIQIGDDDATNLYIKHKSIAADRLDIYVEHSRHPLEINQGQISAIVEAYNARVDIHGMLIQLPLPPHIDTQALLARIHPDKDVDGLHPYHLGQIMMGGTGFIPCTPQAILHLLGQTGRPLAGQHLVIVGASFLIGRPLSMMALSLGLTVTICHDQTSDLASMVGQADILVTAIGKTGVIQSEWIAQETIVIDVGINLDKNGRLCGDIDTHQLMQKASWITPVPGGVGPLTVAYLMSNVIDACTRQTSAHKP